MKTHDESGKKHKREKIFWLSLIIACLGIGSATFFTGKSSLSSKDIFFSYQGNDVNTGAKCTIMIHGRWYYPFNFNSKNIYPAIILFHGYGRTLEDHDYIATQIAQMGIIAFSIDFRGHGLSNGTFPFDNGNLINITFQDAIASVQYLKSFSFVETSKIMALGISMGGGTSVFLAINENVPYFIAWYPALAYIDGNTPLHEKNLTSYTISGLILAGTEDECTRCNPLYDQEFSEHNEQVTLHLLEGAHHTDDRFFLECVSISLNHVKSIWNVPLPNTLQTWYIKGYVGIAIALFPAFNAMIFGLYMLIKKLKSKLMKKA
ncbi:MAG: alpha/beta hydrolase [Promethearchaeota archaeon]